MSKLVIPLLLFFSSTAVLAEEDYAPEYQIKAAFIYNFANFIRWPDAAFASKETPFIVCVLGHDPFNSSLSVALREATMQGREMRLEYPKSATAAKKCHILFLSKKEKARFASTIENVKTLPVLTVSESDDFIAQGGAINFYEKNDKIKLEISRCALQAAGLKADPRLLNLAKIPTSEACDL